MDLFICKMLKNRREELGLSQDMLAERVGVESRTIRRIENNEVKQSVHIAAICRELNIGFRKSNVADIQSEYMSYTSPNVKTGLELAHLLYQSHHLVYYPEDQLDFEGMLLIEDFINKCSEMVTILDHVNSEDRRTIIDCLTTELDNLNKEGLFIYGSCNDLLLNDFKMTELVFVRV